MPPTDLRRSLARAAMRRRSTASLSAVGGGSVAAYAFIRRALNRAGKLHSTMKSAIV